MVMVRSLCKKWKQPVFYDFAVNMSAVLLKQLIKLIMELENISIQIVAVVSDMSGKNSIVLAEVSYTKLSFQNPPDSSIQVFAFADIPHLIKLLRNSLLNSGIILPSAKCVDTATA